MTQQPYGYPPQAPPQQQYAQPPAPQQAQYPAYPPQQGYPAQAPMQQLPPQGYAAPQQAPALAQGTLDDFYNQPSSGGGPSLKFEQLNTRYIGIVTRALGQGDVQQQTDTQGRPLFFKDGRPKFVMKVPLQMQPSATYPDGIAQWYVKGGTRDELSRAMSEAGCPPDVQAPEPGAIIDVTFTGTRNSGPGMNPAKVFAVRYTRPEGATGGAGATSPAPAPQVEQQVQPQAPPPGVPQQVEQPQAAPPQYAQQQVAPQAPVQQAPQQFAAQGQPAQAPQGAPQPPAGLSADQQALLAKLTGQQG